MAACSEHPSSAHLPVTGIIGDLHRALRDNPSALLVAPPGSGKTTIVPPALLPATWLAKRRILLLAPRRMAARAAARRMAACLGQPVGATIGYRVRMETRTGPDTRIEVITEGVLTRMLQRDPGLTGIGLVIFDEFHERSLDADLGLALCRDMQGVLNENLRLLVMSATLDSAPVAALLDGAPLIRCRGTMFPVETRYLGRPASQPPERAVARVIRQSVAAAEGSILVFLPGAGEIKRLARLLRAADLPTGWTVAPLYGNLPRERQEAAISPPPAGQHKIVLATSIAETSLTIEQIRVVVDDGRQRSPRFDPGSGMTRLVTLPVSRASADQRRGRAGRTAPGICYRLWREADHPGMVSHNRPEILDVDLTALALELAVWGLADPAGLIWLDPPPTVAFDHARRLLTHLGALNEKGTVTDHGRQMADVPLHPRLAHMILAACKEKMGALACDAAAILSERDPLHVAGSWRDADVDLRLEAVRRYRRKRSCRIQGGSIDPVAMRNILRVSALLRRRLRIPPRDSQAASPGRLLAWAYPDRIAKRRSGLPGRFLLSSGRGAVLAPSEPLSASDYIVAARLDGDRQNARIFLAAKTRKEDLLDQFSRQVQWQESVSWDARRQAVTARRHLLLGKLRLRSEPLKRPESQAVVKVLLEGIRKAGIDCLPWTSGLRTWQARVTLLAANDAPDGPWPDVSHAALTDTLESWLGPYLNGVGGVKQLAARDLAAAVQSHLTWKQQRRLNELAPTHIQVPSGSRLPIDYAGPAPILAVRIQELFGLNSTPSIAGGQVPLTLHLLSPAARPVQITSDLPGFWQSGYPEVKKELRGRYPKHAWPDDPLHAAPTSRAKPRNRN